MLCKEEFPRFGFLYGLFYKRNRKISPRVPCKRYRNTRGSLGKLEIAWKHSSVGKHGKCFLFIK